jgi:hypothetical protein
MKGYGVMGFQGSTMLASRVMCILAHGEPPDDKSQAAHSCGKPVCINPNHIRWDTAAGNAADRSKHGTEIRGVNKPLAKLTDADIKEIRRMTIAGARQRVIADQFGVSRALIWKVQKGIAWKHV